MVQPLQREHLFYVMRLALMINLSGTSCRKMLPFRLVLLPE